MFRTALLVVALAAPLAAAPAAAMTFTLNLSGVVANTTVNNFSFGGYDFQSGSLELTGFDPFTLDAGDSIDATVTLDGAFVVPASVATPYAQFVGFNLNGPIDPTFASMTGSLTLVGLVGDPPNPLSSGCGNCTALIGGRPFGNFFSFTGLIATGTVDTLDAPRLINSISIGYQVNPGLTPPAVPEPATWALLLGGFGLTGVAARRRRALPVRAA